jgi:glycosyltransferase involved in cell wall biosynthesis
MLTDVTIGLPVTCDEETFKTCIRSIFAQSLSSWELLIVFDGVNEEVHRLATQIDDSRVKVIYDKQSKGLPERLNQISSLASGRYLARMDDDDLMLQKRLEIQLKYLNENPEVDVLGTSSFLVDQNLYVLGRYREPEIPNDYKGYFSSGILCHPSVVMKREWALTHPYDKQWIRTEDKELWLRSFPDSILRKISDCTMLIRVPRNLSIKKFHLTQTYDRRLVSIYATTSKLQLFRVQYILKTYAKQAVFTITNFMGIEFLIYRKKYIRTTQNEIDSIRREINEVLSTKVPGWD